MTKKLRYKFITITMIIVTIMLCIIMSLIYFFTKSNLENNSINMMRNIAGNPFLLHLPNEMQENVRLPYFTLQLNIQGDLIATGGGYFDLSDEAFLKDLIGATFSSTDHIGIIEEYNLRFYRTNTSVRHVLVYADISSELAILNNLIRNCILIGIACFLIFLFISFLLAGWVVRPVEKAWNQQRQFVADASHELKTPLTVIMTNAELMQNTDYAETDRISFAANILVMSQQMRSLVEQMLELARADNTLQRSIPFCTVDLSRLVCDATLPFEPIFFEKGLILQAAITENISVNGNAAQLRQVLDILLDNAQKYSRAGGTTLVALQRHGKSHCLLTVANEGETISPEELKNLFKRFYRADLARTRTGSFGLGLSIAETIITQHKGKIWADSHDHINTFSVVFPMD